MTLHATDIVVFNPKVYKSPYTPYYDAYKNHQFRIVAFHPGHHVELECIDGDIVVEGYVHDDELVLVSSGDEIRDHTKAQIQAALLMSNILHRLEARGIELNQSEQDRWFLATTLLENGSTSMDDETIKTLTSLKNLPTE